MVNAGADIWGNSRQKSTLTSGQMEIFVFTVPLVISIGVGHIDARELIKSTSTLLTVVHLQHVSEIPGKAHLLSCLSLSRKDGSGAAAERMFPSLGGLS